MCYPSGVQTVGTLSVLEVGWGWGILVSFYRTSLARLSTLSLFCRMLTVVLRINPSGYGACLLRYRGHALFIRTHAVQEMHRELSAERKAHIP